MPAHYVESATRAVGPSLTGRILGKFPPVNMYTQHEQWASARWTYTGSVFEGFAAVPRTPLPERISKVVVTVGSLKFPFERMLQRVADLAPTTPRCCGRWGRPMSAASASRPAGPCRPTSWPRPSRESDLVIAHAGTGSALTAHEAGRCPLLIRREPAFGEHIDDHQAQTADYLAGLGLAVFETGIGSAEKQICGRPRVRQIVPTQAPAPLVLAA